MTKALIQLYSKITKLGWLDSLNSAWVFRDVIAEIDKFLQGGLEKCIIGVQLLELLIVEVDKAGYADNARPLTKQRKTASSFRDTTLLERSDFLKGRVLSSKILGTINYGSKHIVKIFLVSKNRFNCCATPLAVSMFQIKIN